MTDDHEARIDKAAALLPAWFVPRMMDDSWTFGLLLTTGQVLCIEHIDDVQQAADDSIWIDVLMLDEHSEHLLDWAADTRIKFVVAPTSRLKASIQAAHVVAAFDLADT